jgi:hypothetical protein
VQPACGRCIPERSAFEAPGTRRASGLAIQPAELYRRALVLDCNSGPPWEGGHLPRPQSDLDLVRNSGVSLRSPTLLLALSSRFSKRKTVLQQITDSDNPGDVG